MNIRASERKKLNKVNRLVIFSLASLTAVICLYAMSSWMLYNEVMGAYTHVYAIVSETHAAALPIAPDEVSDRITVLLSVFFMLGAGMVLPLFIRVALEVGEIVHDHNKPDMRSHQFLNRDI